MVAADKRTAPASRLHLDWEPDDSWLRCVVRWPDTRPPLSRVLPLFGHLGLDLADHRPEGAADTFVFSRVEDPRLDEALPLLAEAFSNAWERTVDRDEFAALVLPAQRGNAHRGSSGASRPEPCGGRSRLITPRQADWWMGGTTGRSPRWKCSACSR